MSFNLRERQVLRLLQEDYEERGYTFIPYPPLDVLPAPARKYHPDAVALKEGDNVAFEVVDKRSRHDRLAPIADLFKTVPGWSFVIVYTPDENQDDRLRSLTADLIERRLDEVERLVEGNSVQAALLLSWSALEAAARSTDEATGVPLERPLSSRQLVEALTRHGWITQEENRDLRELAEKRNSIAHGFEDDVSRRDVDQVVRIIVRLKQLRQPDPLGWHPPS